jgi:hypothetical protein
MICEDRIYGPLEITEPALLALIETRAIQRLKGVLQHGVTALIGITRPVTRYEHSLGVMALTQRLGAGLEEQIAALLHDVSHTAFSHVIDYVFDDHCGQGYHEEHKEDFMAGSDLPDTLAAHGYDWRIFLHDERYPLLEQPSPALCADRLDYFLRDSLDLGLATHAQIRSALAHLEVVEGRIVVSDLRAARWMADTYIQADQASWANFREVGLYELAARAIRRALELGALQEQDLWGGDEGLWEHLHAIPEDRLRAELRLISPTTRFTWDADQPTFWVSTKLRTIDPAVLLAGRVHALSELDVGFAARRADYLHSKAGKWPVRVTAA